MFNDNTCGAAVSAGELLGGLRRRVLSEGAAVCVLLLAGSVTAVAAATDGTSSGTNPSNCVLCGPECCNTATQSCTYTAGASGNSAPPPSTTYDTAASFCVCRDTSKQCGTYTIPSDNVVTKVRCCTDDEVGVNDTEGLAIR